MTDYTRDEPVATDKLSISQPILRDNTNAADDDFGKDHYAFSDTSANNGLHKKVTTVPQVSAPVTAANPILASYNPYPTSQLTNLQYSLGVSAAFPTPITKIQSPSSAISVSPSAAVNIFNFVNIPRCLFRVSIADYSQISSGSNNINFASAFYDALFLWNGTNFATNQSTVSFFTPIASVSQFAIKNTSSSVTLSNVYWTLEFLRIG